MSIYDFTVISPSGKKVCLDNFMGTVLVVVNTTINTKYEYQYKELQELFDLYHKKGFEILAFPSNQFTQNTETTEEIQKYVIDNYKITFPQFEKVEVSGENAIALFKWLERKTNKPITEEFTKFVIGKNGEIVARLAPTATKEELSNQILKALEEKNQ